MDKAQLKKQAGHLKKPSLHSYNDYVDQTQMMINAVSRELKADPDFTDKIGDNEELMETNLSNHAQFMSSLFLNYDANVFVETILWVYRTYMSRGVKDVYWLDSYRIWLEVIKKQLPAESFQEISPFYQFMLQNHPHFVNNAIE